jgi:hypothetical protein
LLLHAMDTGRQLHCPFYGGHQGQLKRSPAAKSRFLPEKHTFGKTIGINHERMPMGPMILAADSIIRGYNHKKDSFNPVLHELAHYLDFDLDTRSVADDAPMGLAPEQLQEWHDVRDMELEKLDRKESPLSDYAMSDTGELFACAVEMFFENPEPLKSKSPELYGLLRDYFQLDPLALYSRGRNKAGAKADHRRVRRRHGRAQRAPHVGAPHGAARDTAGTHQRPRGRGAGGASRVGR